MSRCPPSIAPTWYLPSTDVTSGRYARLRLTPASGCFPMTYRAPDSAAGEGKLPGERLAVPGQGAGGAAVGDGDRPDDAGRGLGERTTLGVTLAGGPARADRGDENAVPGQFRGEQPGEGVEPRLGDGVRGRAAGHHGDRAALAAHVDDPWPRARAQHRQKRVDHPPGTKQ